MPTAKSKPTIEEVLHHWGARAMPFCEGAVAERVVAQMRALDFDTVEIDAAGNAVGVIEGSAAGPTVLYDAHMDTVDVVLDPASLSGTLGYDPVGALADDGVLEHGLDRALSVLPDMVAWTAANAPDVGALNVSSIPYSFAGATAVQELSPLAGHPALERVDAFLTGVLTTLPADHLVFVVSDHGNIEDTRGGHTRNPALGLIAGPDAAERAGGVETLMDVTPAVLGWLGVGT